MTQAVTINRSLIEINDDDVLPVTASAEDRKSWKFFTEQAFRDYSPNTQRAYRQDAKHYADFHQLHYPGLPLFVDDAYVMQERISSYIRASSAIERPPSKATMTRRINILSSIMSVIGVANPFHNVGYNRHFKSLIHSLFEMRPQKQAFPFKEEMLEKTLKKPFPDLLGLRNLALLNTAFDSLGRVSEIARMRWENLSFKDNFIRIPTSKTNKGDEEDLRFISNTTLDYLKTLQLNVPKHEPYIFLPMANLHSFKERHPDEVKPLQYNSLVTAIKSAAKWAGIAQWEKMTGHSTRIGAAISMRERGIEIEAIRRSGGWKRSETVERYLKQLEVKYTGAARAAAISGR